MDEIFLVDDVYVKITHEKNKLENIRLKFKASISERRGRKPTKENFFNSLNFNVPLKTFPEFVVLSIA